MVAHNHAVPLVAVGGLAGESGVAGGGALEAAVLLLLDVTIHIFHQQVLVKVAPLLEHLGSLTAREVVE